MSTGFNFFDHVARAAPELTTAQAEALARERFGIDGAPLSWVASRTPTSGSRPGPKDVAGHPGAGPGFCASLLIRPSTGQTWVVLTNRKVLVESINERLAIPITSATRAG